MPDRILFISSNSPPLTGGMEGLMFETVKLLQRDHRVTFIGPKGSAIYAHDCGGEAQHEVIGSRLIFNLSALVLGA